MRRISSLLFWLVVIPLCMCSETFGSEHALKVAITPVLVEKNAELNERLIQYIGEKLGMPVTIVQRKTYQEINDLMAQRQVDVAFVCSLPYIVGKEKAGMELLVVPKMNGEPYYYSYVIVPADSRARSIEDLKGKLYAYPDPLSNSGFLYPRYRLAKAGHFPDLFFSRWIWTHSHTESIEAVSDGFVDGASVDSYVYDLIGVLYPDLTAHTKVIEVSPPFGHTPVVVRKDLTQDFKRQLRSVFLSIHEDRIGRSILRDLHLDGFVDADDTLFDEVRKMYEYLNSHYRHAGKR